MVTTYASTTQTQSQTVKSAQQQNVSSNLSTINMQQGVQQDSSQLQNLSSVLETTSRSSGATQKIKVATNAQNTTVAQQQNLGSQSSQSQTGNSNKSTAVVLQVGSSVAGQQIQSSTVSPFVGYAVFDLQGNRLSDTYGQYISVAQMVSGQFHLTSNQTGHYDLIAPNAPITLIVKAVDANGNPITNPLKTVLYLRSSNYSSKMTMDGTAVKSLVLDQGSLGVPFQYTNIGGMAEYDVVDVGTTNPNAIHVPSVQQTLTQSATQSETVKSQSAATLSESQNTSQTSNQSQTTEQQTPVSQDTSDGTTQTQSIGAAGPAAVSQNQKAGTGTNEEQTWSSNGKLLSAPSSTNRSLQQAQAGQSASSATASESQSTTFASGSSMRLDLNQQQNQNTTSFLQTESINASVANPGTTASTPGTLYIYKDGVLQATYGGVTGNVTASEQQNLSTANATDTTESASVDFISGGSRVQLSI